MGVVLSAEVTYSDGSEKTVNASWSSSDTTIASVNSTGQVYFSGKKGTVTITADYGGKTASQSTTVGDVRVDGLKIKGSLQYSTTPIQLQAYVVFSNGVKAPASHWAEVYIAALSQKGIVHGYQDGTFRPDRPITREEAVAMLSKLINVQAVTPQQSVSFKDIGQAWGKATIDYIASLGIVNGINSNEFAPDQNMTRAQAVVMLLRTLALDPVIGNQMRAEIAALD